MDEDNGSDLARDLVKSFLLDLFLKLTSQRQWRAEIFCLITRQQKINLPEYAGCFQQ
jgi:hypothetical protein